MIGRLYINGFEVDLSDAVPFPLNYSIADVREPDKRKRNFSKTIKLPGTPRNMEIFSSARLLTISDIDGITGFQFDPTQRAVAEYYRGQYRVFNGLCELADVELEEGGYSFNINLLSSFTDLFQSLGQLTIAELGWSEYDHPLTRVNVKNSWNTSVVRDGSPVSNFSGGLPLGFGYLYGLVNWGYNNGSNLFATTELIPLVYWKEVIDKAFAYAGLSYSSNFLTSALFRRLLLSWEGGDRLGLSDAEKAAREVSVDFDFLFLGTYSSVGTPNWSNISNAYTVNYFLFNNILPAQIGTPTVIQDTLLQAQANQTIVIARKGNYRLFVSGDIKGSFAFSDLPDSYSGRVRIFLNITRNGQNISVDFWDVVADSTPVTKSFGGSVDLQLQVGDVISYRFSVDSNLTTKWSGNVGDIPSLTILIDNSSFSPFNFNLIALDAPLSDGDEVNLSRFLPSMKVADFLKGVITAFNLYISDPDENGVCRIEPLDSFYTGSTGLLRWREKLDRSKLIRIIPTSEIDGKLYVFQWQPDRDYWNEFYREAYGRGYGDFEYQVPSTYQQGERVYKLPFAQTIPVAHPVDPGLIIPQVITFDKATNVEKPFRGSPRVFIYNGLRSGTWRLRNDVYVPTDPATFEDLTTYPQLNHLDDLQDANFDLNWGVPDYVFWAATAYTNNNLWAYHEKFVRELTGRDSKIIQAFFKLNNEDVWRLDFSKLIEIDGVVYRLNKIVDFDPDKQETTMCELVKMIDIDLPGRVSFAGNEITWIGGDLLDGGDPLTGGDTGPNLVSGGINSTEVSANLLRFN